MRARGLKSGDWVLTNRHVVEETDYLIVRNGLGEIRNVKEVFLAENDDLAILVLDEVYPQPILWVLKTLFALKRALKSLLWVIQCRQFLALFIQP